MGKVLNGMKPLEPSAVWNLFYQMAQIPHGSKNEAALMAFLKGYAEDHGCEVTQTEAGLIIRSKATPGCEGAPIVVIQGHLDMVCEKNADVQFNFEKDGLILDFSDPDWVKADGTTLGADNGIGVAAGLAIVCSDGLIPHGDIEVLLTIDEETGLTGANKLDPKNIEGRILLNLDSEETDIVYIGCAGGGNVSTKLPLEWLTPSGNYVGATLTVSGLRGGHSGCDIHENRGNAVKLLARVLEGLQIFNIELADFHAGDKHNAIPREGSAILAIPADWSNQAKELVANLLADFRSEFPADKDLNLTLTETKMPGKVLNEESFKRVIGLLLSCPNGVMAMSQAIPGLVETSSSLASAHIKGDALEILNSPRSSNASALRGAQGQIGACGDLAGAKSLVAEGYPGWQPNPQSRILAVVSEVHEKLFGKKPDVKAIHAGLECGLIGGKIPDMDMVSFGPDIRNPHSPDERVHVGSVKKFFDLLCAVLKYIGEGGYTA